MNSHSIWLGAILLGGALLRLPALWWGLPPPIPHVVASDIRCSYAFEEDDLLTAVSHSKPAAGDFDPRDYRSGTLHLHLLQFLLQFVCFAYNIRIFFANQKVILPHVFKSLDVGTDLRSLVLVYYFTGYRRLLDRY